VIPAQLTVAMVQIVRNLTSELDPSRIFFCDRNRKRSRAVRQGIVSIDPATEAHGDGAVQRRKRLAGLLSHYHRAASLPLARDDSGHCAHVTALGLGASPERPSVRMS
jgi:hypothetical protein